MYEGWLGLGGNEIVNSERARAVAEAADCPMSWFKGDRCWGLPSATGATASSYADVKTAPWYDPAVADVSSRFYGAYGISVKGIPDSTATAGVTESVDNGGTIGRSRDGTRRVVVRAYLAGQGADAIDYGMSWLNSALRSGACGQHATECGLTDLEFYASCPPERAWITEPNPVYRLIDPDEAEGLALLTPGGGDLQTDDMEEEGIYVEGFDSRLTETASEGLSVLVGDPVEAPPIRRQQTDAEYAATLVSYRRFLHDVGRISGPTVVEEHESRGVNAYVVEFVIAAERPWVFSPTVAVDLPPSLPVVVQDIPYNLARFPSAELPGPDAIIGRNFSTNPSVEVNADHWNGSVTSYSGPDTPTTSAGRVTGEISAVGTASYRTRLVGAAGAGANAANLIAIHDGAIAPASGERVSVTIWGGLFAYAGTATLNSLKATLYWRDSGNALIGSPITLETLTDPALFGGYTFIQRSLVPPVGTARYEIEVVGNAAWGANADVRLYADAAAVMIP